jgi:fatty-acyl-CoA synthase
LNSKIADLNVSLPQKLGSNLSDIQAMAIKPTPTNNSQIQRLADFDTLTEGLILLEVERLGTIFMMQKGIYVQFSPIAY